MWFWLWVLVWGWYEGKGMMWGPALLRCGWCGYRRWLSRPRARRPPIRSLPRPARCIHLLIPPRALVPPRTSTPPASPPRCPPTRAPTGRHRGTRPPAPPAPRPPAFHLLPTASCSRGGQTLIAARLRPPAPAHHSRGPHLPASPAGSRRYPAHRRSRDRANVDGS